jgi:crotonobetainyl-CoA:carnitine CoA-transferase CaiB-like acyl-CoA transferase
MTMELAESTPFRKAAGGCLCRSDVVVQRAQNRRFRPERTDDEFSESEVRSMEKVLKGVRVLDFTDRLAGPFCTRYLADCGCEVINVETPGGANCRTMPYNFDGQSTDYMYNHCGKKSIVIDLKTPEGHELALRLAKLCDVVVENFRPGVMGRLGLDYAAFRAVNPAIVMCSISGWGQTGPYSEMMGADVTTQAYSGILDLTGPPDRRPCFVGIPITDILAGLNAFGAVCAALYRAARTGIGDYIDIALVDCVVATLRNEVGLHILSRGKEEMRRRGSFHANLSPYGVYRGRDGYLVLSCYRPVGFQRLAELMGKPDLPKDPRFDTLEHRVRHNRELTKLIEAWLRTFKKVGDAVAFLQSYRIMAAPVLTVTQIVDEDPQIKIREMLKEIEHRTLGPVKFLNTPLRFLNTGASVDGPPPAFVGEHTSEVLEGLLKLPASEIETLRTRGIVT